MWNGWLTIRDSPHAGQRSLIERPMTRLICSKSTFKVGFILREAPATKKAKHKFLTGRRDSCKPHVLFLPKAKITNNWRELRYDMAEDHTSYRR